MNPGLVIRSAITLLAVACLVYTVFFVQSQQFPFTWRTADSHTLVGTYLMRPGVELDLWAQSNVAGG